MIQDDATHEYAVTKAGRKELIVDGRLHSVDDRPAVVHANGALVWYCHGMRHREGDRPAAVFPDGSQYWYWQDMLHREGDLPAVVYANGVREWWRHNALLHRSQG